MKIGYGPTKKRGSLEAGPCSKDNVTLRRSQTLLASSRGDEVSQIARNLGCGQQTVRDAIHDFNERGLDRTPPLVPKPPGAGVSPSRRQSIPRWWLAGRVARRQFEKEPGRANPSPASAASSTRERSSAPSGPSFSSPTTAT